jgi:multidrug resistance efflux pump
MKRVNLFYIAMIVISLALIYLFLPERETEVSFFGFAENQETEINYNYAVMVEDILVSPGQEIEQGTPLIKLMRMRSNESLVDEPYKIATLRREMEVWKQKKESDLMDLQLKYEEDIAEMAYKIEKVEQEIVRDRKLKKQFYANGESNPALLAQKERLQAEKTLLKEEYRQKKTALENEKKSGLQPFQSEIAELEAKQLFEESHKEVSILVKAPLSGLIGNINCREGEHIPAFKTLMTFYEPHSSLVKGYIHEESIMEIGDSARFEVSSLLQEDMKYTGKLVGMGSRIVEIPTRLRKFEQIKSYGREITIEIPIDNNFIQKEKVGVKLINE